MDTPPEGLTRYDHLPAAEATVLAWAGLAVDARALVWADLPVLARALDRLTEYERTPPNQRRPHWRSQPPLWQDRETEPQPRPVLGLDDEEGGAR